jgi:hypothetical protein
MILGRNAAAKQLGISGQALLKAVKAGRVPRLPDGTYDVEVCREALNRNSNPGKQANARAQQQPRAQASSGSPNKPNPRDCCAPLDEESEDLIVAGEVPDGDLPRLSTSDLCKQELIEKVLDRRMDRRIREGQLLQRDDIKQAWCDGFTALRSQVLLLSSLLTPHLDPRNLRDGIAAVKAEERKLLEILSNVRVWE